MATLTTTPHNHQVIFGRRVDGCPRCTELKLGMPARAWRGYSSRRHDDAMRLAEIRAHNCSASRCGPVCTFGDW